MTDSPNPHGKTPEDQTAWEKRVKRLERTATLETLEALGFDVEDVNEIQKDILFLRQLRTATQTRNAKLAAGIIGFVFTLMGAFATIAVQQLWPKG